METSNNKNDSSAQLMNEVEEVSSMNHEIIQSTQFDDNAPVNKADFTVGTVVSNQMPYKSPSLEDYLSRVFPLKNIAWASSSSTGTLLARIDLPHDILRNRSIREKINRFQFLKSNFHMSVRCNGTAFHYGKLLVMWSPTPPISTQVTYKRLDNIYSASAFPNVILSAGENEVVEFDIPFIYPFKTYNMDTLFQTPLVPVASVFIYVLNPLSLDTGVVPDVGISVYGNMVDPILSGYCQTDYVAIPAPTLYGNPIVASPATVSIAEREEEVYEAQIQVLGVPMLQKTSDETITLTKSNNDISAAKIAIPKTLNPSTLKDIFQTPGLLDTVTISSSQGVGTTINTVLVNPIVIPSTNHTNGSLVYHNPLSYITSMFNYWSGSINYKVQFVCSRFHSCRIQIIYIPSSTALVSDESYETLSRIVDIQTDTEFKFSIPYCQVLPALDIGQAPLGTSRGDNGKVYFRVVNALTYKSSPVPDIYMNVWISGGDDYTLSIPCGTGICASAATPSTIYSMYNDNDPADDTTIYEAQIAINSIEGSDSNIYPPLTDFIKSISTSLVPCETTIAEVAEIPVPIQLYTTSTNYLQQIPLSRGVTGTKGDTRFGYSSTVTGGLPMPFWQYLALIFRFRSGPMNYRLLDAQISSTALDYTKNTSSLSIFPSTNSGGTTVPTRNNPVSKDPAAMEVFTRPSVISCNLALQPISVNIPYINNHSFVENVMYEPTGTTFFTQSTPSLSVYIVAQIAEQGFLLESAAPGFEYLFRIGAPSVFIET